MLLYIVCILYVYCIYDIMLIVLILTYDVLFFVICCISLQGGMQEGISLYL